MDLADKCQSFLYNFNPREVIFFCDNHHNLTKALYLKDFEKYLMSEFVFKLDSEWKSQTEEWLWDDMTWEDVKKKVNEKNKLRFSPLERVTVARGNHPAVHQEGEHRN